MLEHGKRVKVYRNLRTGGFSIVDPKTGRVIGRENSFYLINCDLKVGLKGQERARNKGQRNVHAYVWGDYYGKLTQPVSEFSVKPLQYNPFKDDWFNDGENVMIYSPMVLFQEGKAYVSN